MADNYEARSERLLPGWNDEEATQSHPSLENPHAHPDLCINCSLIMQELAKYLGDNGDDTLFSNENQSVQLARFQEDQHLKTQECRFCRVIQTSNPGRFVDDALYPRLALLSKRSDWEVEMVWQIEFAESSTFPSPLGKLYMVPVPEVAPEIPDITSWISYGSPMECAKSWLKSCEQHHDCFWPNSYVPARLLSIGTNSTGLIRLVLKTEFSSGVSYATLSHCWGNYMPVQLLSSNLTSFQTSIDFSTLSLTFREAIVTARAMGISYIWIDSLCIIQDSASDWRVQSKTMDFVYSSSSLNICAAAATDGRAGLFFPRKLRDEQDIHSVYQIATRKFRIIDRDHWCNTVESLPLLSRAWVYQERQLAPRNLYFGAGRIAWECDTCRLSEAFPTKLPMLASIESIPRLNTYLDRGNCSEDDGLWMRMVTEYTQAQLTFHSDKLIALSGIALKLYCSGLAYEHYLAGVWRDDLINQLLWFIPMPKSSLCVPTFSIVDQEEKLVERYIAPSWSWAQTSHPIKFHAQTLPKAQYTLINKNLGCLLQSTDMGFTSVALNAGIFVVLATQICKVSLVYNTYAERCGCCPLESYNAFSSFFPDTSFASPGEDGQGSPARFYPDLSFEVQERGFKIEELYCIPLAETVFDFGEARGWTWTTGLVLVRCDGDVEEEKGAFKRWGTWKVSFNDTKAGLGELQKAFDHFDGEQLVRFQDEKIVDLKPGMYYRDREGLPRLLESRRDGGTNKLYQVKIF